MMDSIDIERINIISEVGGFTTREIVLFHSCVQRAVCYGCRTGLKSVFGHSPFSLLVPGGFTFPLFSQQAFPFPFRIPPTRPISYPALAGFTGVYNICICMIVHTRVCNIHLCISNLCIEYCT